MPHVPFDVAVPERVNIFGVNSWRLLEINFRAAAVSEPRIPKFIAAFDEWWLASQKKVRPTKLLLRHIQISQVPEIAARSSSKRESFK